MRKLIRLVGLAAVAAVIAGGASAQQVEQLRERINTGTVTIVTGGVDNTLMMSELAEQLNLPGSLRILPVTGEGGVQNIADILYLRGIDMAVVPSDTLELIKSRNLYPKLEQRVRFISKLYLEEIHLLANKSITDINDLAGRRVNFGAPGTGSYERSELIFRALGISPIPIGLEDRDALEKVQKGEIEAMIYVAPKPSPVLRQAEAGANLHLLSIPFAGALGEYYVPISISSTDYPDLVAQGESVKTLAVSAVMCVYNWPEPNERSEKVDNFVKILLENIDKMHASRYHPKWQDVSLSAELPGWQRLQVAQLWLSEQAALRRANEGQIIAESAQEDLTENFRAFLTALQRERALQPAAAPAPAAENPSSLSEESLKNLFSDFLEWRRVQTQ